jgi:DNA-binding transcriptional LysR family regulator
MPIPDWDDIRVFAAIAATGSLSAAATRLGTSQPTVGRRLRALERATGARLVERIANRIELTETGQRLARTAATMDQAAQSLAREALAAQGNGPIPVRITATGSLAYFLADHLAELLSAAETIPVTILAAKQRANLAQREADIALRMRRLPEEGDLMVRKLGRAAFTLYGLCPTAAHVGPVIGLPVNERRPSQSAFVDDWAGDRPLPIRLGDVALRHHVARQGVGATLLPCWLGDGDSRLVRLLPPPPQLEEDIFLMVHRDLRDIPAIDQVTQGLVELFRRHAALLDGNALTVPA